MASQWELMEDISSHLQYSQEEILLIFEDRYYTAHTPMFIALQTIHTVPT